MNTLTMNVNALSARMPKTSKAALARILGLQIDHSLEVPGTDSVTSALIVAGVGRVLDLLRAAGEPVATLRQVADDMPEGRFGDAASLALRQIANQIDLANRETAVEL